jgi:5'-3' exonuclease
MGISSNLIKQFAKYKKEINLEELIGKCVAIDVSNEVYRALLGMKYITQLTDKDNNPTSHILVMLQNALKYQKLGIDTIYVFDNKPHDEKELALEKRRVVKNKAKELLAEANNNSPHNNSTLELNNNLTHDSQNIIDDLNLDDVPIELEQKIIVPTPLEQNMKQIAIVDEDDDSIVTVQAHNIVTDIEDIVNDEKQRTYRSSDPTNFNSLQKQAFTPTQQMFDDIKLILTKLGIKWCLAPENCEAEQYCALLTQIDVADYVMSSDADCFLFGAKNVIRRETVEVEILKGKGKGKMTKKNKLMTYNLDEILAGEKITLSQLIDIGIALGTDYSMPIKGIGIKTALKNPDNISKHFDKQHIRAKEIFEMKCNYTPIDEVKTLQDKNIDDLKEFLLSKNISKIVL